MIHIRFGVPISYLCCRFCNTPEHDDYEPSGREGESEVWGEEVQRALEISSRRAGRGSLRHLIGMVWRNCTGQVLCQI